MYVQYLPSIIKTEKLTKNKMKKNPQAQIELIDYKDSELPRPFTLSRHQPGLL